ncbi:MAG: site-2 protease family protein, partial [Armatimonadota bacterium]
MARSIFTFLWVMTLLVVVHELGHYLFARLFKMKVNAFAVFMGGIRRTDLRPLLDKPLASRKYLVGTVLAAAVLFIFGAQRGIPMVGVAGVVLAGWVLPLWTSSRLGRLYHLPLGRSINAPIWGMGVALLILFLTRQIQSFSALQIATVLGAGAWIGTLWVYYLPTRQRMEEDKMGMGSVDIEGTPVRVDFKPVACYTHKG